MSEALAELLLSGWKVEVGIDAGSDELYSFDLRERQFIFDTPSSPSVYLRMKATLPIAGPRRQYQEGTWALPVQVMTFIPQAQRVALLDAHLEAAAAVLLTRIRRDTPELLTPKEGN